jgi:putative MFS transporter
MVLRALTGFGLGGALPLDFAVYAEYLPSRNRGRNLVLESFWALGHGRRRRPGPAAGPHRGLAAPAGLLALAAALVFWIRR